MAIESVTGLLSEADACPNLGSKNIGLLSEAVSFPNWTVVRILDQNI